ncbi:EutN/CcmL family microcompartment protein [Proteiniborus sp. MB09-C3]|uniref:EutN/CcmL family microcompartment protein n=1 Tax=Proteiniborus sp. MB09-C3 TaxID=3050072 RepID=UPI002553D46B|nr:EutN/CcmL family microcompartment protein [Proteiniborus sp. MB09-C3]WIV12555.1 EutN/CcmL family microcompartment protein [Proteiniborus sp. MB09-C3]
MQLGRVIGTVVATRKSESLVGSKLLITQPIDIDSKPSGKPIIAVDTVGAGIGEIVFYATGTASRNAADKKNAAIDAAIVGIVDNMDVYKELIDE